MAEELNELAGGRYLIQEPLGEGGSGSIYRAWDQQLGRMVALKRIKENPSIEASIRHEAGILATLDHPNVVTVFDFGADEKGHFVVMELLNGRTLEEIVLEQPLSVSKFIALMNQICRGLAAAHSAGLVHCDLKPANIMLQLHKDGSFTTKILDFGLATASVSAEMPESDTGEARVIQGSPLTISPEQLEGYAADIRSDIYSLGCTFYFTLTGVYPHDAEEIQAIVQSHLYNTAKPLHRIRGDIPEPLSLAIMKMLSRDPNARPQDAETVRLALEGAARAPSAMRRDLGARGVQDYSRRPTGTITSTIPPQPNNPAVRMPAQSYEAVQYAQAAPQQFAPASGPGLRTQIIISCSSLLLIALGAGAFYFSSKKPETAEVAVPEATPSILQMIQATPTPAARPSATPKGKSKL